MAGGAKSNAPGRIEEALLTEEMLPALLFLSLILGCFAVVWMALQSQRRIREMEHRERLAMIERGLIPPPELDPALFERGAGFGGRSGLVSAERSRSIGVMLIGIGLGLIVLLSFAAGLPESGVGIGGALAVLGAAFYVNGMLAARQEPLLEIRRSRESSRSEPGHTPPPDPAA